MNRAIFIIWVGFVTLLSSFFYGCGGKYEVHKETRLLMGTLVEITVGHPDRELARRASARAFDEMARVEALISSHSDSSEIGRVNFSAGEGPVPVSAEVFTLLQRAESVRTASGGAFDVTIGPLVELWQFDHGVSSSGSVRSGQARSGRVRPGPVGSGPVRSGQVRTGRVRSGGRYAERPPVARRGRPGGRITS